MHDLHQHVQRATVHAEGDGKRRGLFCVALQLGLFLAAVAPSGLMHRQEAARGLVNVDDAVCADGVLVHEPAQLDEEAVRVGVLLLRAVESLQAAGGLLVAQAHASQEPSDPLSTGAHVEPLCVEPFVHEALESRSIEAQDVGNVHDVLDAVEHSGAQALDLAQAPPHVPVPLGLPLVHHVEEPVAGDGIHEDLAAFGSAATWPVFDGRSCSGARSLDLDEFLVRERPADGFSWSPPGRPLQARTLRELMVVDNVLLQGALPEFLSAGPSAGLLRVPVWWPTQTNRQGDGGPLGPHVVKRRSCEALRRGGALADEAVAVHGKQFTGRENTF